jgi:membrane protein
MRWLLKTALVGWWNDRAMSLGASIAFFTVFSLAPMLLVAIAVAGLAFGREAAQGAIVAQLAGLTGGQTAAALEGMIASASSFDSGVIGAPHRCRDLPLACDKRIIELHARLCIGAPFPAAAESSGRFLNAGSVAVDRSFGWKRS